MVSCSQVGRSRCKGVAGARFFEIGGWVGCARCWAIFGVVGISFGFGGATCGGGVVGFEEPGLLELAVF